MIDDDETPVPLDPVRWRRRPLGPGVVEIDGLPVRRVTALPEETIRDRLPFVSGLD